MKLNKAIGFLAILAVLILTLAACGDNSPTTGPVAAPTTAAMTSAAATTAAMTSTAAMTTAAMTTPAATTAAMTSMAAMTTAAPTTAAMTSMTAMTSMAATSAAATSSAATTQAAAGGKAMEITISDFNYMPDTLTVPVGTKVTWINKDSVAHTVTSDDSGGPLKSSLIDQNKTFEYTFDKAGTYAYHCEPHPFMKAKIVVQP